MNSVLLVPESPQNLTELFAKVAHLPWALLLDSASKDHPNSRYQILLCEPCATLTCQDGLLTRVENGQTFTHKEDPFSALKALHQRYFKGHQEDSELPFTAGIAGYFGYELGQLFEPVPEVKHPKRPLADLAIGVYLWALVYDLHTKKLYYTNHKAAPQSELEGQWQTLKAQFFKEPLASSSVSTSITKPFELTSSWQANMSQATYLEKFNQVKAYLQSGDCYQINLAQRFFATYQGDEWQAYLKLRERNAAPFSAFFRTDEGAVLSLSPERFIEVKAGKVETKPIKGTLPRSNAKSEQERRQEDEKRTLELKRCEKSQAENVMIVDLLRNDLGKYCKTGTVRVPSLFAVESFPAVHHLVSTVTGELRENADAFDLLRGAFPGGSITGAPKVRAMQIISELEPHPRSVYCGAMGYVNAKGDMDSNIAIRTLVMAKGEALCWAGGGLVADSLAQSEYQETFDKVQRILPVLAEGLT